MIEETAMVISRDGDRIRVQPERQSSCGHCAARSGCGTAVLSRYLGRREAPLELVDDTGIRPGERVRLGIRESALLRGSLTVYMVPLLTLGAGALLVESQGGGEGATAMAGLAGLALGFLWVARRNRRLADDPRYRPVVLGRAATTPDQPITFKPAQRD